MPDSWVKKLFRKNVEALEPYKPILPFEVLAENLGRRPEEIVKLDANENPYGPSPKVLEALASYPYYHIYPDPQQKRLRKALSGYVSVPADNLLVGSGADELIDLLVRLFVEPGEYVVNFPPTFGMYEFDAEIGGGRVLSIPRRNDFSLDVDAAVQEITRLSPPPKLLFVTSPNNPDGGVLPPDELERLIELPIVVVVDEAYNEFSGAPSFAPKVLERENLVVLRTFSKWAGLAGLRLGYGVFPQAMLDGLWKIKQPYNVNVAATVAGLAALEDMPFYRKVIDAIISERERLYRELQEVPYLRPFPSKANFVLCRVVGRDAYGLKKALEEEGIIVRHYHKPGLENMIRISVGRPEQNEIVLERLKQLV